MKKFGISVILLPALVLFLLSSCQNTASIENIPTKKSEIVDLKDGDTYEIVAAPVKKMMYGKEQELIAYNGMLPGPTLRVNQGATVNIVFKNNTDTANTIHSHGVRMENAFDGIPDVTQKPVAPGETFVYKLYFPDAGVFWYHPHMAEPENQERGLFGNFIVVPAQQNKWKSVVDREIPLIFHDILVDEKNRISSFGGENGQFTLMGRYGNKQMTNWDENYVLSVKKGEIVRLYLTNASNARPYNIVIDGVSLKRIGGDNGSYERETWEKSIVLGPSERSIVEVRFDTAGIFPIVNRTPFGDTKLGTFDVLEDSNFTTINGGTFDTLHTYESTIKGIDAFRGSFEKKADKDITLTLQMKGMMADHMQMMAGDSVDHMAGMKNMSGEKSGGIEWEVGDDMMAMMNQMSNKQNVTWKIIDNTTRESNMMVDWKFKQGEQIKIRIFNDPKSTHPMQHPIHFHGQRFLILAENGIKNDNLVWKDTVMIPTGQSVDILVDMSNPGDWMAHCHISSHLEGGMMLNFLVQ